MVLKSVDVYSGSPRWFATQDGVDITIVKATQGTGYVNEYCDTDYQAAKSTGKLLGVYHYAGGENPVDEANYFLDNIEGYIGEAVLIIDWESYQNSAWGNTNWVRQFVDRVHERTQIWPVIYVQESALGQVANCANNCGVWVAKYPSMDWNSWTEPDMNVSSGAFADLTGWQFTGGDMDRSFWYLDANGWRAIANGDRQQAEQPAPSTAEDSESERIKSLSEAGKLKPVSEIPDQSTSTSAKQDQGQTNVNTATSDQSATQAVKDVNETVKSTNSLLQKLIDLIKSIFGK